ncbi:MAG: hypothetical protein AAB799_00685 [Patescibacteria group bacterium]
MEQLLNYFSLGLQDKGVGETIGMEIETSFVNERGEPITLAQSQQLLILLCNEYGWFAGKMKNNLLTSIFNRNGNRILYELGRQNIELSSASGDPVDVFLDTKEILGQVYNAAARVGAFPSFQPILDTEEELLVIPDERDAIWLELDGRQALELLARTSSVQFTVSVSLANAIQCLNKLGRNLDRFLADYPQDEYWKKYIKTSKANYNLLRYGGPLHFDSLEHYCAELVKNKVVVGPKLVPYQDITNLDIPLYLRSIWWYFRLRRYDDTLCIEVRPLGRWSDDKFAEQMRMVFGILDS